MFQRLLKLFFQAPGARPFAVTMAMTLSSLSDLMSMGALVPLASQLSSDDGATKSFLGRITVQLLGWVGIAPTFVHLLAFAGLALVLKSLIALLSIRFVAISVANVAYSIRTQLLNATLNAKWSYFVDHQPGEVAAMVAAQSQMAGDAYLTVSQLVVTVIVGIGLLITAFMVSGTLVFFCLVAVVSLAVPLHFILRRAQAASAKQFSSSANLSVGIQDVISNMKALKSMAKQSRFVEGFMRSIHDMRGSVVTMLVSRYSIYYGQDILAAVMITAGIYVATQILQTPLSQLLVVGVIFYQMVDVVKRTQMSLQDAVMASSGYFGIIGIIEKAEAAAEPDIGAEVPVLKEGIALRNVGFSYGEKQVLSGVNVTIPAGQITVFIGPSGAGKTTIVDLIVGFYRPLCGDIFIDSMNLKDASLSSWRKKIGYVPQELTLLRGNVFDNIRLGDPAVTEHQVHEALDRAGALQFVQELPKGVYTDIGTMGAKLSGGQRQRLSIARALIHRPQLLLLDEVTSALDEATEAEICRNIQELLGHLTIVAITHRPAWMGIASKVYSVSEGSVIERTRASPVSPAPQKRALKGGAKALRAGLV